MFAFFVLHGKPVAVRIGFFLIAIFIAIYAVLNVVAWVTYYTVFFILMAVAIGVLPFERKFSRWLTTFIGGKRS